MSVNKAFIFLKARLSRLNGSIEDTTIIVKAAPNLFADNNAKNASQAAAVSFNLLKVESW